LTAAISQPPLQLSSMRNQERNHATQLWLFFRKGNEAFRDRRGRSRERRGADGSHRTSGTRTARWGTHRFRASAAGPSRHPCSAFPGAIGPGRPASGPARPPAGVSLQFLCKEACVPFAKKLAKKPARPVQAEQLKDRFLVRFRFDLPQPPAGAAVFGLFEEWERGVSAQARTAARTQGAEGPHRILRAGAGRREKVGLGPAAKWITPDGSGEPSYQRT
jgi:hypothetical protein